MATSDLNAKIDEAVTSIPKRTASALTVFLSSHPGASIAIATAALYFCSLQYAHGYLTYVGADPAWFKPSLFQLVAFSSNGIFWALVAALLHAAVYHFVVAKRWVWFSVYAVWIAGVVLVHLMYLNALQDYQPSRHRPYASFAYQAAISAYIAVPWTARFFLLRMRKRLNESISKLNKLMAEARPMALKRRDHIRENWDSLSEEERSCLPKLQEILAYKEQPEDSFDWRQVNPLLWISLVVFFVSLMHTLGFIAAHQTVEAMDLLPSDALPQIIYSDGDRFLLRTAETPPSSQLTTKIDTITLRNSALEAAAARQEHADYLRSLERDLAAIQLTIHALSEMAMASNAVPRHLEEAILHEAARVDRWGTAYRYVRDVEGHGFRIYSAGPDRLWDTPDDLSAGCPLNDARGSNVVTPHEPGRPSALNQPVE